MGGDQAVEGSVDIPFPRCRRQQPRQLRRGHGTSADHIAVGQDGLHLQDVLDGPPIHDRVGPGRVVPHHAPQRRPVAGGEVGSEPQVVGAELFVQLVQDHAGLDARPALLGVDLEDPVQVLGHVQDHRPPYRLAGQGGPGAARQDRHTMPAADLHRGQGIVGRPGDHHAQGLDLVDAGVGAVEHLGHRVEADLPRHALPKVADQIVHAGLRFNGKRTTDNEKPGNERGVGRWVSASAFRCPVVGFTLSVLPCPLLMGG